MEVYTITAWTGVQRHLVLELVAREALGIT